MTRDEIISEIARLEPWFHCIDLGDGLMTKSKSVIGEPTEHPRPTWEKVRRCLPDDLSGQNVLDVGCNAGFYSIEMKRRGATRVLGIDSQRELIRQANFVRGVLGLEIDYQRMSVYDLDPRVLGQFDVTLALGLIYHCKHLVLALERLFLVTRRLLVLETAIYPSRHEPRPFVYSVGGTEPTLHPIAYIENQPDAKEAVYNWFLPGTSALCALLKNIGFDEVEVLPHTDSDRAVIACRKHEPYPDSRAISYLASKLSLTSGPASAHSGEVLHFTIRAENTGNARWLRGSEGGTEKGDVHLVAHLLDQNETPIAWYHAGVFLPHDIAPGESVELEIALNAPATPGSFLLQFDMVSEHLAWFEDLGSEVLEQTLTVEQCAPTR
jgi:tRNA (mo5U34)-methyltransferase